MRRKRPPYAAEFREQMIELVGAGRTPEELSREFELGACDPELGGERPIAMKAGEPMD